MGKFKINQEDKENIRLLYENYGILLEGSIWGALARLARTLSGKNSDEIAEIFKKTEIALAKQMDDIVLNAVRTKNKSEIDDLIAKIVHSYNPSGLAENLPDAKKKTAQLLNGYAKSRGKNNFQEYIDEITGGKKKTGGQDSSNAKTDPSDTNTGPKGSPRYNGIFYSNNLFSGKMVGDESAYFKDQEFLKKINWNSIANAKDIKTLNRLIADALKSGDYKYISRGGFEQFGITDFRKFLSTYVEKIHEAVPNLGEWKVTFKPTDFTEF